MSPTVAPPRERVAREPIDPRIRARRIEVKRTEGRRRLQRAGVLLCGLAAVAGLWAITLTPAMDVDAIRIDGATHTGAASVLAVLDIRRGDALLTADVGGAARAVTALPWVATAEVRRRWPGTIDVRVVERTAVAAIAAKGGGWVVVDAGSRQLAVEEEPAVELVRIAGRSLTPEPGTLAADRFRGVVNLAAVLPASLRPAIASLWPQRDGAIEASIRLPGGGKAVARFGPPDQLEAKLVALAAVLERAGLTNVRIIDLRVPGAPALTRG